MSGPVAWLPYEPGVEQSVCGYCMGNTVVPGGRDGLRPCKRCGGTGDPPLGTPPFRSLHPACSSCHRDLPGAAIGSRCPFCSAHVIEVAA